MKSKLLVILILNLFLSINSFSQNNDELDKALTFVKENKLVESKQVIDKFETDNPNTSNAKFWFYKGLLYHSIFEADGSDIKNKYPNAIEISYNSYKKAIELDKDKTYNAQIFKALGYITNQFMHEGLTQFNSGDYDKALLYFENTIEINTMPEIMFYDTIVYYNAALSAEKLKNYDKAESYYKILISYGYGEGKMYKDLSELYKITNREDLYVKTLVDGAKMYPQDNNIYIELINHYLMVSDVNNAFKYVKLSLQVDSTNAGMYFVQASLYESKNDFKNAEKAYLKSLEIDPKYLDSAYNLGALYYNKGNDIFKHAKTNHEKEKYENYFNNSLKYFKIVEKEQPNDKNVLLSMRNIYRILGMDTEKVEIDKRLESL